MSEELTLVKCTLLHTSETLFARGKFFRVFMLVPDFAGRARCLDESVTKVSTTRHLHLRGGSQRDPVGWMDRHSNAPGVSNRLLCNAPLSEGPEVYFRSVTRFNSAPVRCCTLVKGAFATVARSVVWSPGGWTGLDNGSTRPPVWSHHGSQCGDSMYILVTNDHVHISSLSWFGQENWKHKVERNKQ